MQTKFACSRRSFALPRRYSICSRQAKYTQKPRAMQEAEGKCKQSLHAGEDFCIAEARQYMWPRSGQITQKLQSNARGRRQMQTKFACRRGLLHSRGATVYVAAKRTNNAEAESNARGRSTRVKRHKKRKKDEKKEKHACDAL